MKQGNKIIEAIILAIGLCVLGFAIQSGINHFADKDRSVTVKGLAETEVKADKVTWPIVSKEVGNDLPTLYEKINEKNSMIKRFLLNNHIKAEDIEVNAPSVVDLTAERWSNNDNPYRYNITSVITVTSKDVDIVRGLIARQGELLQQGIAIVVGDYDNQTTYEYVSFQSMKPKLMQEAIQNAQNTAAQFATNSKSKLDKIIKADQGQFSIESRDNNTPYIKKVRVVTTITYSLKN